MGKCSKMTYFRLESKTISAMRSSAEFDLILTWQSCLIVKLHRGEQLTGK